MNHIPSNFSDEELISHIRHHFPDIRGSVLEVLLERFEQRIDAKSELLSKWSKIKEKIDEVCEENSQE